MDSVWILVDGISFISGVSVYRGDVRAPYSLCDVSVCERLLHSQGFCQQHWCTGPATHKARVPQWVQAHLCGLVFSFRSSADEIKNHGPFPGQDEHEGAWMSCFFGGEDALKIAENLKWGWSPDLRTRLQRLRR